MFGTRGGGAWPPFRVIAYPSLLTGNIAHSCPFHGHLFGFILEGCKLPQQFKSREKKRTRSQLDNYFSFVGQYCFHVSLMDRSFCTDTHILECLVGYMSSMQPARNEKSGLRCITHH